MTYRFGAKHDLDSITYGIESGTDAIALALKDCRTPGEHFDVLFEIVGRLAEHVAGGDPGALMEFCGLSAYAVGRHPQG